MTIDTFKKLAALVEEVSIDTKKHMIDIMMSWDETGHVDNVDEDQHFTAFTSGKWYYDEEITRTIARKADYLECSDGYGWAIFVGRYCDEETLEDAFEAGFGWSLECSAEFGELTNAQLDVVEECGVELEFASRCRQWNDETAAQDADATDIVSTDIVSADACITADARPPPLREQMSEISFIIH